MDIKRKITLGAATLAVAFGAGHLVQSGKSGKTATEVADAAEARPTAITPLAASAEPDSGPPPVAVASVVARFPSASNPPPAAPLTDVPPPVPVSTGPATATVPGPVQPPAAAEQVDACRVTLDVSAGANGMLDLTLLSPCQPSTRVVLRHGGLAVTGRTSGGGALFTALPAMEPLGEVSAMFPDGTIARGAAPVDLSGVQRVAVQWMADDRFALNAFQGGAAFGAPGHVHAGAKGQADAATGWMMPLGDASVDLPMLAEVYTWPVAPTEVAIDIEAPVTEATCDRELLGETLDSRAGTVTRSDITLAMPDCAAVGDFLVLNYLRAGMTTAAAE
ncbi:MAG: hypothetical protein ACT4OK_10560 [Gemmobacter sp.]